MLPSTIKIGIIGGGQLGKMLIEAGKPWNIHYTILETDNAPAQKIANEHIVGHLYDSEKIKQLAERCDVITYEIEHIDTQTLLELEASGKRIIPSPQLLQIIQDKGLQKDFFSTHQIATAPYLLADNSADCAEKVKTFNSEKVAIKLRKGGYDGKGVELLSKQEIANNPLCIPFDEPCVIEAFVPNAIEIAIIVARNEQGEIDTFPSVEMEFNPKTNLVEFLFSPANISEEIEQKAKELAIKCVEKLNGVGLFAIEMFLDKNNELYVNEIAPRPHNSGHHTIEACYTSQYEQLNRILLKMPLGSTQLIQPAAMLNLLGAEDVNGKYELTGLDQLLSTEGIYIHLYNKSTSKPHRKMGHITVLGTTIEEVKEKATFVQNNIGMIEL